MVKEARGQNPRSRKVKAGDDLIVVALGVRKNE